MSAQSLEVITTAIPADDSGYFRVNGSLSFTYVTSFNIRTLTTKGARPGSQISGLLYVPTLEPGSACNDASAPYLPINVTRKADLPDVSRSLVSIAPWLSPNCVEEYLVAAQGPVTGDRLKSQVRAMLWFLPHDSDSHTPPGVNDEVWGLGDGGSWKAKYSFPSYAIPGATAKALLAASAVYSQRTAQLPHSSELLEQYNATDAIRLLAEIQTAGSSTSLPSLWAFLLIVLGVLLGLILATSFTLHLLQHSRRKALQRRVQSGEIDLEALGVRRLTVPLRVLDTLPLYPFQDANGSQQTCAICLDDFEPGVSVRELPCKHIFHPECIDTFLTSSSSLCPLCKKTTLPQGYCPVPVTNAMVRRVRHLDRTRERPEPDRPPSLSAEQSQQVAQNAPLPSPEGAELAPATAAQQKTGPLGRVGRIQRARQRAHSLMGPALLDPDEEERHTPRWRRLLLAVFPGR